MINIKNKKAKFQFILIDKYTAGIVLKGTEIKSVRLGKVSLVDTYCQFMNDGELFVHNMHIAEYTHGNRYNHEPKRVRKLLLSKRELFKLNKNVKEKGTTIVVTRLFINERGFAKVEIALAKGKKLHDKRESLKEKDDKRQVKETFN